MLERARHAEPGDRVRRQVRDRLPDERDRSGVGDVEAGNHVDQRRLARAVRSDQSDDLALAHGEIDAVERPHAAELLDDVRARSSSARSPDGGCSRRPLEHAVKHRPSSATASAAAGAVPADVARPQPFDRADDAVGRQDQDDERRAGIGDQRIVLRDAKPFAQEYDQQRPDDGAEWPRAAADHRHDQACRHQRQIEVLRRDDTQHLRHQRAGTAAVGRAQAEMRRAASGRRRCRARMRHAGSRARG